MVNGIEQMQIEYGVDADLDNNADFYADAATVSDAKQWNRVASVRLVLVVRSDERGPIADTTTYYLPDKESCEPLTERCYFTYPAPDDARMYQRKVFTSVVQIRNRSRS